MLFVSSGYDTGNAKKQIADLTVLYIDELTKVIEKFEKKFPDIFHKDS